MTGPAGSGQAVLIRAIEPTTGLEVMAHRRGLTAPRLLASGPGRLTQALGVTLGHDGEALGAEIDLRPRQLSIKPGEVIAGPRIGISEAKDLPWRFRLAGNRFVSRG